MAIETPEPIKGLEGLKGIGSLSKADYDAFVNKNRDLIAAHHYDPVYINSLYSNKQFIDRFGLDAFKETQDAALRQSLLRESIINEVWNREYSPFLADGTRDNTRGLGADWEKYNEMSSDAKLKLMQSGWLKPTQFNEKLQKHFKERSDYNVLAFASPSAWGVRPPGVAEEDTYREAVTRSWKTKNDNILNKIYNEDSENRSKKLAAQVRDAYYSPEISQLSDDQVCAEYNKAITPGSYTMSNGMPNMGIGEYKSHWGEGTDDDISSEMKGFAIDDMRMILAKKKVYDQNMSPEMATTVLNNEAKEYIKDHQGKIKRFGLFAKDVGISALSYTMDKANGFYNLGLMLEDAFSEHPTVMIDDQGNVLDPLTKVTKAPDGTMSYIDKDGETHAVHYEQVARAALHNMGRNSDGSEDTSVLNPQYWTRAEQFGTLDKEKQKQYEKLGSSPYKVAYGPNEDSDLWYESFKMMSFGLADGMSQLIPYGLGKVGSLVSTASKAGKVLNTVGKAMDYTGKMLTAQSKVGQITQGTAGALGIAYAYQRGAYQETLAQNLANAEEAVLDVSRKDVYDRYHNDPEYKAQIDEIINTKAAELKANYFNENVSPSKKKNRIVNREYIDKLAHEQAQESVLGNLVQERVAERKQSDEYGKLQQEAITSTNNTANSVFLPEAIKYGLINTVGFRKYLYTNPASLEKKARRAASLNKRLNEVTNEAGKQRLTVTSKFSTIGDKWKEFGKSAGQQVWGGAWTNGTDDMMVDGSERINEDEFGKYLNAYRNGEAIADTYGILDGMYSYFKGLGNSLGQNTTWNATAVGALGSVVSGNINFANLAHLATKEGREAYKNTFMRRPVRDKEGNIQLDDSGNPITEKVSAKSNWRERVNYFVQNGVLNNYYAKKQQERELQDHAVYVNRILDDNDDFKDIQDLLSLNLSNDNTDSMMDNKTIRYIEAIRSMSLLDKLCNNATDPALASSVIRNIKSTLDKAANDKLTSEEATNLVAQYYSSNPGLKQNDANNSMAINNIRQNAQKLIEAAKAYEEAGEQIDKIEKQNGSPIRSDVKDRLRIQQALNGHWRNRIHTMQQEIGDTSSSTERDLSPEDLIASIGGLKSAQSLRTVYQKQIRDIQEELEKRQKETESSKKIYDEAVDKLNKETDSTRKYQQQQVVNTTRAEYENNIQKENHLNGLISATEDKINRIDKALKPFEQPAENGEGTTVISEKILTADEIFRLDPVTRAKMMDKDNRQFYSKEQQKEIEKLEQQLLMKDGESLQKIQDISSLTQRVKQNEEAYSRIAQNPEAAAAMFDKIQQDNAVTAYRLINQRNAETIADAIDESVTKLKQYPDISREDLDSHVFNVLKRYNTTLLDIMDEDGMLPENRIALLRAKDWVKTVEDIQAVIDNSEREKDWKDNIQKNIASVVDVTPTAEDILPALEKVIDTVGDERVANDFDFILKGLTNMGYQRDANTLETRRQRLEREAQERSRKAEEQRKAEEEKKRREEEAQKAAEEDLAKQAEQQTQQDLEKEVNDTTGDAENAKPVTHPSPPGSPVPEGVEDDGVTAEEATPVAYSKDAYDWFKQPSLLMEEDAEDGSQEGGTIWYGTSKNPKKGTFTVTRKGDALTFSIGEENKATTLTLSKEDWEYDNLQLVQGASEGTQVDKSIGITKDDEVVTDEEANSPFRAKRIFKGRDGNWYAEGEFAVQKDNLIEPVLAIVKLKKDFNLTDAVDKHTKTTNARYMASGVNVQDVNLTEEGDNVVGTSSSVEQQAIEETGTDKSSNTQDVTVSNETTDAEQVNELQEQTNEISATTLSGNAMANYEAKPLREDGILVRKKGENPHDSRNTFNAWMDAAGIKLQNIIDEELGQILARNPNAKVKFMVVRSQNNATHDMDMKSHLLLVLDYDNAINKGITNIHNDKNGGVIESNGKKYLVVGTVGYGNMNSAKKNGKWTLWNTLYSNNPKVHPQDSPVGYGLVKHGQKAFFDEHPTERFYVNPNLSTEIVPYSLIPGWRVRQLEDDKTPEFRSISELLADPVRNPRGEDMESLAWGIQELTKFLVVEADVKNVMVPRDTTGNLGRAFVLIPAGNNRLLPAYFKPLFFNEMKDGTLKDRVNDILRELVSPNYATRLSALKDLCQVLYLDKDGDTFLLRKTRAEISLVSEGKVMRTFTLDSSFDMDAFREAVMDMNPRINITANVLKNTTLLKQYDEAGALMTDIAKLETAGSSYNIYGLDTTGKMLMPETTSNEVPKASSNSDLESTGRLQVPYNGQFYREVEGRFYAEGSNIPITDTKAITQLQYNKRIIEGGLSATSTEGVWGYYILDKANNEVVKVNKNNKEVKVLSEKEAQEYIEKTEKEKLEKEREKSAEKMDNKDESTELLKAFDVELEIESEVSIDPITGEMILPPEKKVDSGNTKQESKEVTAEETPVESESQKDVTHTGVQELGKTQHKTQSFKELILNPEFRSLGIRDIIKQKWPDAPKKMNELAEFLQKKGVEISNIGTTKADVKAWMDKLQNCTN